MNTSILQLRNYQLDIIDNIKKSWAHGFKRNILVLPCGAGKTAVFAYMAQASAKNGRKVWFLVHRQELLKQTLETFKRFEIPLDNITIGMVATVANHINDYPKPDFIIFDECHFSAAATWQKIIAAFPEAYITGLTATPCRLDGKPLGAIYQDLVEGVDADWLIQNGYLSDYRYFAPTIPCEMKFTEKGTEYDMTEAEKLLSSRAVFGDVIENYKRYCPDAKAIAYCTTKNHSKATAQAFCENGINAVHFDSDTPKRERERIIEDFRSGTIRVLCNVDLISVGFDCPDCEAVILLRPTMSTALFIQQSMRAMRYSQGKTAVIIDCVNNYKRHGLPTDKRNWTLTDNLAAYRPTMRSGEFKVRQCEICYATFSNVLTACPVCHTAYAKPRAEIESIKQVQLKEIEHKRKEATIRYKETVRRSVSQGMTLDECRNMTEVAAWCKLNGKKPGYGYYYGRKRGFIK